MADPHIQSPMDVWDKLTVIIYRTGFVIAAFSTFALTWYPQQAQIAVLIAATCCASSLHIYLKHFRLTFQFATWLALLCALLGWHELALGSATRVMLKCNKSFSPVRLIPNFTCEPFGPFRVRIALSLIHI